MADEKNEKSRSSNNDSIGLAVAGIALTALGAAAGAVLANKEFRGKLGKKTEEALKVVSKLALQAEKGAESGLRLLESKTRNIRQGKKIVKKSPVKTKLKKKSGA